ncbi:SRPBCC domain-containing protein [Saccharomonospora sp. NPDC046836]|uniref:SRPBCC family protein n=1 Tax=Saccharomonospora sp. NPDC046836 TaxID=3156921 RepID=UPI0033E77094
MADERRHLHKRVELDANVDEVWRAVSTVAGMSAWFVPHEADEKGDMSADFGDGNTQGGKVLAWEAGKRVVYGGPDDESPETAALAIEFLVEGRDGGGTVLRLMQSGFSGEGWEAEYEGMSRGWDLFLHNLVSYFQHFAGLPAAGVVAMTTTAPGGDTVSERVHRALGVDPQAAVGDQVRLGAAGIDPVTGVVDVRAPGTLGVRTGDGLYRFFGLDPAGTHGLVHVAIYRYGVPIDRAAATAAWQGWLQSVIR